MLKKNVAMGYVQKQYGKAGTELKVCSYDTAIVALLTADSWGVFAHEPLLNTVGRPLPAFVMVTYLLLASG